MKTVCIAHGEGCPRAQVDTALLFDYFEANGWTISDSMAGADLVVVAACAFDTRSEKRGIGMIEAADRKRRADSRMVVVGCIAGISHERLRETFDAIVIPPSDMQRFDDVIAASVPLHATPDPHEIEPRIDRASRSFSYSDLPPGDAARRLAKTALAGHGLRDWLATHGRIIDEAYGRPRSGHYSIRVARGCMSDCTYCAIRIASGPLHSKPLDEVLAEFDAGLATGHTSYSLLAQDLGAYGQDIGTNVAELLDQLFRRSGDFTVTMNDFNVRWLVRYVDRLLPILTADATRVGHLAVPTQSGSDRILGMMRRGNTASAAARALGRLRDAAPDLQISTHVLVGFPGETEDDFQQTLDLLRIARFNRIDAFGYSDRPGTPASSMAPKVARSEIRSRTRRLRRAFPGVVCVTR